MASAHNNPGRLKEKTLEKVSSKVDERSRQDSKQIVRQEGHC